MALALIPLFFINARNSHDWGGDFAMYIMQAINIVDGLPQSDILYIYNPDTPVIGPPAYSIGFPLILSPVYTIFGNSIAMFTLWLSCFLFALGILMSIYFRQYFNKLISFFLVLIIIYNPWTLNIKLEIISEFPFAFLLLLLLLIYEKCSRKYMSGIVFGLLGGLLISIRMIGVAFPIAVLIFTIWNWISGNKKTCDNNCIKGLLTSLGSVIVFFMLNNFIFSVPQAESGSYVDIWEGASFGKTFILNLAYYVEQFKVFFSPWSGDWNFLPSILKSFILTFTILGMLDAFTKRLRLVDIVVVVYFSIILIYPYRNAGIRFLFPIIPFLLLYLVDGLKLIRILPNVGKNTKTVFLGILLLASYLNMFLYIVHTDHKVIDGPQTKASTEVFDYIKRNTKPDAVFLFAKPRVLSLYAERKCLGENYDANEEEIALMISKFSVEFILVDEKNSGKAIKHFLKSQNDISKQIWSNKKFRLYEIVDY